jgi:hypothetical protein
MEPKMEPEMVITYSPEGKDVYIYLTDENPGEAERSVPNAAVRLFFDEDEQWLGFEVDAKLPDGSALDLANALTQARKQAPEAWISYDKASHTFSMRWEKEKAASVVPWDAILDFDDKDQLVGIEFLFTGELDIEGRLDRLPHQRI